MEHAKEIFRGKLDLTSLTDKQREAISRILERDPTCRLVEEFLLWADRKAPRKNTGEAIDEFLAVKQANSGASNRHIYTLGIHMRKLDCLRDKDLGDITPAMLPELTGEPRSRKNVRSAWITFFRWCQSREYLPHGEKTAPERLEAPIVARKIPATYTPAQLRTLLEAVPEPYLPWLALAAFAGLRTDETCPDHKGQKSPLDWSDFHWDRKIIIVRPETAKTKHRRVVPILPVLESWLKPIAKTSGSVSPIQTSRTEHRLLTAALGKKLDGGWQRNALRHSFISYRAAEVGLAQTAMEAGNSESEAKHSYNDAKSKDEAREWFSLFRKCSADKLNSEGFSESKKATNKAS